MIGIHHIKKTLLSHQCIHYIEIAKYILLSAMALLFVIELILSLDWRLQGDAAFLQYIAYLISEQGFVPYRDIFELNMPMTYLIHMAIGAISGYSDFAFQFMNICWLLAIFFVTWLIMRPMGQKVACAGCLLFGFIHLYGSSHASMGRDFILLLPIATAILLALQYRLNRFRSYVDFFIGICFGLVASIKPHFAIGLPVIIIYNTLCKIDNIKSVSIWLLTKNCARGVVFASLGFACAFIPPFLWLWHIGALEDFWKIYSSYIPLYTKTSYDFANVTLIDTLRRFIEFGGFSSLVITALFGVYIIFTYSISFVVWKQSVLLLVLALVYSISVLIGVRILGLHWIAFFYFLCLCTGMLLFSSPKNSNASSILLAFFVFILITVNVIRLPSVLFQHVSYGKYRIAEYLIQQQHRVDAILEYLNKNLIPGDKVQPLESIDGVLQAMLISKAVIATPYVTDFQFYHHINDPYIQYLRRDFISRLQQARPEFIIKLDEEARTVPSDAFAKNPFPALERFIQTNYREDFSGDGFIIFRKDSNQQLR